MAGISTEGIVLIVVSAIILVICAVFVYYMYARPRSYSRYKSPEEIKTVYDREIRRVKNLERKAEIEEREREEAARHRAYMKSMASGDRPQGRETISIRYT